MNYFDTISGSENIHEALSSVNKILADEKLLIEAESCGVSRATLASLDTSSFDVMKGFNFRELFRGVINREDIEGTRNKLGLETKKLNNMSISDAIAEIDSRLSKFHEKSLGDKKYRDVYRKGVGHLQPLLILDQIKFVSDFIRKEQGIEANESNFQKLGIAYITATS